MKKILIVMMALWGYNSAYGQTTTTTTTTTTPAQETTMLILIQTSKEGI